MVLVSVVMTKEAPITEIITKRVSSGFRRPKTLAITLPMTHH